MEVDTPILEYGDFGEAKREICYAYKNVPLFRDHHIHKCQVDPREITKISQVPATSKVDYRKNFPLGVLANGYSPTGKYVYRMQSSGTSGDRLTTISHKFKLAERTINTLAINKNFSYIADILSIKTCRFAPPNCSDVECSNPNAGMSDRLLDDGTLILPAHHDLLTTPEDMIKQALIELSEYKADIWFVDPAHFVFLINKAKDRNWEIPRNRKIAVFLSYTMTTSLLRRQIEEFLNDRSTFSPLYAMTEFGYVGMECEHATMHLNDKDYFLEFISYPYKGGGGQELWELVVTSIGDRISPHIRYQVGDLFSFAPQCCCNNTGPAVVFEGRKKDVVELESGHCVTLRDIDRAVKSPNFMSMYQIQVSQSQVALNYIRSDHEADEYKKSEIASRLSELFEQHVEVRSCEYFPFERGGKLPLVRKI